METLKFAKRTGTETRVTLINSAGNTQVNSYNKAYT